VRLIERFTFRHFAISLFRNFAISIFMSDENQEKLEILTCPTCKATGFAGWTKCPECRGMAMGRLARGKWLYWSYPLTRYHLTLARGRRVLNHLRWITALVLGINSWIWAGWVMNKRGDFMEVMRVIFLGPNQWLSLFEAVSKPAAFLFWLGVGSFSYVWYRSLRARDLIGIVESHDYSFAKQNADDGDRSIKDWKQIRKISRRQRLNIAEAFTDEAKSALAEAYKVGDSFKKSQVELAHLFCALLSSNRVSNIFIRLGISAKPVQQKMKEAFESDKGKIISATVMPLIANDFQQALFEAYEEAYRAHQHYVSVTEILLACVKNSDIVQELLFDLGVNNQKLANAVEWARIKERLYRQYQKFSRAARHRSKKGMDKAMTALATPYLNQFSEDLTLMAQFGHLDPCIARETEIEEVYRVIEGGQQNVILVGDHGVGKRSVIEGLAQKMVEDDVPKRLRDKRFVRLSVPSLVAGTTAAGAVERLQHIMHEISRAGNIILFIHNIHELVGVVAGEQGGVDVADTLAEYLKNKRFLTLATTTNADFSQHIMNSPLGNVFTRVDVVEMNENQAIQVLEAKVGATEYKHKVFFSYDALEKCVQFSSRYLHDTYLPGTALEVMTEAASFTSNNKGRHSLVTSEEVGSVVAQKTGIPVTAVTSDESAKLLNLEREMHQRVIGQDEGVAAVANALRRARAEFRSTKRPIANFLFLGPTGVGKTELAKTIATIYFGGEERMIRLDMSEYQDKSSIHRLIGAPGDKGGGMLTEAVRRDPFSLLLLDEIEKADPDILNIFLQVMDDGRLTDSAGRVIDFTNVILIATSNAGTSYVQEQLHSGASIEAIRDKLLHGELKQYFRPEFLNRFDGIILFKPLSQEDIKKIAGLMLKRVAKDLEAKGIELRVEPAALEFLARAGFDPDFGARPMRRTLEDRVENNLASLFLAGKLRRRDVVVIGEGGKIRVE